MPRWTLRACVLLVAGGLLFAWVPDVDLGDSWRGDRAESAPEGGSHSDARDESGCLQRNIDGSPDPSTDITDFVAQRAGTSLMMVASFHDLLPDVQQSVEFDLRTIQGREVNVRVDQGEGRPVEVVIGDAPDPVQAAASAGECPAVASLQEIGECYGLTARMDARADLVTVRVPRHCLGNARWVRAGVASVRFVNASRIPQDVWRTPGHHRLSSFGPLGPWVSLAS